MSEAAETTADGVKIDAHTIHPDVLNVSVSPCSMSDCSGRCCQFGAVVDQDEIERISPLIPRILSLLRPSARRTIHRNNWHFSSPVRERYSQNSREYRATRVAEGLCIFVQDSEKGGCALHALALEDNVPISQYKPRECILFPLSDLLEGEVVLHRWKGYPCTRRLSTGPAAVHTLSEELIHILGEQGYQRLLERAARLRAEGVTLEAQEKPDPAPVARGRPPRSSCTTNASWSC